jgi:N-methylhydantoinase A
VTARLAGAHDIITFDMGGTSTDVALLQGSETRLAREAVVHGYPIKARMLDIHTVGAGGGSIAFIDTGRLLKVGPRSAGADPGPACYDRGNEEPTVTDANVVLQTLNPTQLLGGRMRIRPDLARAAIDRIAARLEIDALTAAQVIIAVVTANMAHAIRVISVQRGHDPRDCTLVALGGAGPLHAARLAAEHDIHRVLVPRNTGILCAMGLLLADLRADFAAMRLMALRRSSARSRRSLPTCGGAVRCSSPIRGSKRMTVASHCRSTCATPGKITNSRSRCPPTRSHTRRSMGLPPTLPLRTNVSMALSPRTSRCSS